VSYMVFADFHNTVALDASTDGGMDGGPGLGGFNYMDNSWFKCCVPESFKLWFIRDLELLAHVLCMRLWGGDWVGRRIHGLTDSEP
jgi:hypothetical protein